MVERDYDTGRSTFYAHFRAKDDLLLASSVRIPPGPLRGSVAPGRGDAAGQRSAGAGLPTSRTPDLTSQGFTSVEFRTVGSSTGALVGRKPDRAG